MAGTGRTGGRSLTRARTALAVVLAVLAGLLAPLSAVAGWAQTQVGDTEAFVAGYAPLARAEPVQRLVTDQLTAAITARVPGGDTVLVRRLVARQVAEFAGSDLFTEAWTSSLRLAHAELRSLATGEPGRLQVVEGQVQLRLAPFAEAVKERLASAGVPGLHLLPEVTGGIPLVQVDPRLLPIFQGAYRALAASAGLLPWATLLAAVGALWAWPSRRRAVLAIGLCAAVATTAGWLAGRAVLGQALGGLAEPFAAVAGALADAALAGLKEPGLAIIVAGLFVATLAWLSVDPDRNPDRA